MPEKKRNVKRTKSAGAVVIHRQTGKIMVVYRGEHVSLPKGHMDKGERAEQTAVRETHEETGVPPHKIVVLEKLGSYGRWKLARDGGDDRSEWKTMVFYRAETGYNGKLQPRDPLHPKAKWVSKRKAARLLTHPKDRAFFRRLLKRGKI